MLPNDPRPCILNIIKIIFLISRVVTLLRVLYAERSITLGVVSECSYSHHFIAVALASGKGEINPIFIVA